MRRLACVLLLALSACAQPIILNGRGSDGAACTLANDRGSWRVTMPATVNVVPSRADLTIDCAKPGWVYHAVLHAPYTGQNFTEKMKAAP